MAGEAAGVYVGDGMSKKDEALKLALEDVYETIIQWDEGGGKRSRRELARRIVALAEQPAQQEPVAWVYPEGLEALKNGKPWTAYGTKQEANNIALYLHPAPEREPYAWVTFTPCGDEDDVWYENPEGKLLEGWTCKPLYDTSSPANANAGKPWVGLTDREVELLDGMIEVQLHHANQCDRMANRVMADKQKGWDMERVELLRKLKEKNT